MKAASADAVRRNRGGPSARNYAGQSGEWNLAVHGVRESEARCMPWQRAQEWDEVESRADVRSGARRRRQEPPWRSIAESHDQVPKGVNHSRRSRMQALP